MKRTVVAFACALATVPLVVSIGFVSSAADAFGCLPASVKVDGAVPVSTRLDAEQTANARTIVEVAVGRRLPSRAAVIAVATALQESDLRNIPYGDRDSLGLFQQRPSQGWGGPARVMNPVAATNAFLDRLVDLANWPVLPLTVAAQTVQRSAFPDAYTRWEPLAAQVVAGLLARPEPVAGAGPDAADTPGIFVLADGPLADLGDWPTTFQGGPVSVNSKADRDSSHGLALLQKEMEHAPGTVLVSLGSPATTSDRSTAADVTKPRRERQHSRGATTASKPKLAVKKTPRVSTDPVRAVLDAAGDRSIYWLTNPSDPVSASAVRHAASTDPRLTVIDLASALASRPEWLDHERLSALGRAGVSQIVGTALGRDNASETVAPAGVCGDGLGGYSAVPIADCGFAVTAPNRRNCADAIRWALAAADGPAIWERKCLHFVARAYGWEASGVKSAATFWVTAAERHTDGDPPAGALVFWATGNPDGHVALSLGHGLVASNDIGGAGTVATVPLAEITDRWHATYLGWAPPIFHDGI